MPQPINCGIINQESLTKTHMQKNKKKYIAAGVLGVLLIAAIVWSTATLKSRSGKGLFGISVRDVYRSAAETVSDAATAVEEEATDAYRTAEGAVGDAYETARGAISDAGAAARKEIFYTPYKAYMYWVDQGVSGGKPGLSQNLISVLQPHYSNNLAGVRIAYTSRFSGLAMTDCSLIYFGNRNIVNKIKDGKRLARWEFSWLTHETAHIEQCFRKGGRKNFADMWFRQAGGAALEAIAAGRFADIIRDITSAQRLAKYEGNMSMEVAANQKANIVTNAAFGRYQPR